MPSNANSAASARPIVIALLLALGASPAAANDWWPIGHPVLEKQRQLPCDEVWQHGTNLSDSTHHVMTFDTKGRLLRREEPTGPDQWPTWQRYHHSGGRIVKIEGKTGYADIEVSHTVTLRYDRRGRLQSILSRETSIGERFPKPDTTVIQVTLSYEAGGVVRIRSSFGSEGAPEPRRAEDIERRANGRLLSVVTGSETETATYDTAGRLSRLTRTSNSDGQITAYHRYFYDTAGRLLREEFGGADGGTEQTTDYSYQCTPRKSGS
jgi:YD repeat-containing protein